MSEDLLCYIVYICSLFRADILVRNVPNYLQVSLLQYSFRIKEDQRVDQRFKIRKPIFSYESN